MDKRWQPAPYYCDMASIHAATVWIKKRDGSQTVCVENVVITGDDVELMKRSPENLRRALYYGVAKSSKEDQSRWVITEIITYKKLGETNDGR